MDIEEYLEDPCGKLPIPYRKAKTLRVPDSVVIIRKDDWNGQFAEFQRFFRVKHDLKELAPTDFDHDTLSLRFQAKQLSDMINASYAHANITVSEEDVLGWTEHETFREELCVYINAPGGVMAASGIAEYDDICREGFIEWVQVLPEYRRQGLGRKIVAVLLRRLRDLGAGFATVSGDLDNVTDPLGLYRSCGFTGDDLWYVCRRQSRQCGDPSQ